MPFTEDITEFFNTGEFATACDFQSGITTTTINCIFYQASEREGSSINKYFYIDAPTTLTSIYKKGDCVTINGTRYRILSKEISGTDNSVNRFEITLDQA